jgi:predicted transcriptional regulator
MANEEINISFYVVGKEDLVKKLDAVCVKLDRTRSYTVALILEENIDKYLKR